MNFTVYLGGLPAWVDADDIESWLVAENLAADSVKLIRDHETQESRGFAFVEASNADEMEAIIQRFDRAPLEDRLLRASPAQPLSPESGAHSSTPRRGLGYLQCNVSDITGGLHREYWLQNLAA